MDSEITSFIDESESHLNLIKPDLENDRNSIVKFFEEEIISKIPIKNIMIQDRIKGTSSLREKIIRKNYFIQYKDASEFINDLPDLIGIRLVCLLEKEEEELFKAIEKLFSVETDKTYNIIPDSNKKDEFIKLNIKDGIAVQKNGHKIYKINAKWVTKKKCINIELQIKSLVHTFWGEIEHMLFYKNYMCMISGDFYKSFMDSTFEILHSVDYQLEIIKEQLKFKDDDEQIYEMKEMATRILYNTYQADALDIFGCNIDLKEAFEFIVNIKFKGIKNKEYALTKTSSFVNSINSRDSRLDEQKFKFEKYEKQLSNISRDLQGWAVQLEELINSRDVFWSTFFAVYKIIEQGKTTTELIDEIASAIKVFFNEYNDQFEQGTDGIAGECSLAINEGILEAFKVYKKIDFFSEKIHKSNIIKVASNFVYRNQEIIYELEEQKYTQEEKSCILNIIKTIIKIEILAILNIKISVEELERLKVLLDDSNNIIGNLKINKDELENRIKINIPIMNYNEYINLLDKGSEE